MITNDTHTVTNTRTSELEMVMNPVTPEVGMGATVIFGSRREPGTITRVDVFESGSYKGQVKSVHVQYDTLILVSGSIEERNAVLKSRRNTNFPTWEYTLRADGRWTNSKGCRLLVGLREYHEGPSF